MYHIWWEVQARFVFFHFLNCLLLSSFLRSHRHNPCRSLVFLSLPRSISFFLPRSLSHPLSHSPYTLILVLPTNSHTHTHTIPSMLREDFSTCISLSDLKLRVKKGGWSFSQVFHHHLRFWLEEKGLTLIENNSTKVI